jgi:hypothetical protein
MLFWQAQFGLYSKVIAKAPLRRRCVYDAGGLRQFLAERGTIPVIPNNPMRKTLHSTTTPRRAQSKLL